ncbi:hypothetical protein F5Y04DRAFT_293031 [Hypomontagnella monticulosa]|nr:hypothetical protein F5Y04DRAFT_293031 [Hypomontagnella monticulosa]
MAAESIGLAASVAGLMSLGLQVTNGVVQYINAFKSRQEELVFLRQQNNTLSTTLSAIQRSSSRLQAQSAEFTAAMAQGVQSCQHELSAAEDLCADLSNCDRSTWATRLNSKKGKITYAFHRPKIQQLAQRLQQANEVLQLALTGLGLEISSVNSNKLTTIESSSQAQASELLLIRSEVAAVGTPVTNIVNRLPLLQDGIDTTTQLVISRSKVITDSVHESTRTIQQDIQLSHNAIQLKLMQQQESLEKVEQLLKSFRLQDGQDQVNGTLAARAASKPAVLKELYDSIQLPGHSHTQQVPLDQLTSRSPHALSLHNSRFTDRICICSHPYRYISKEMVKLAHVYLSKECEKRGHWPSCPLSRVANKNRRAVSMKYTGMIRMLKSVFEITFAWTSGAGGSSISPNFTYYPTVDIRLDPAFRIVTLTQAALSWCLLENMEYFTAACLRKLVRLFSEKKASPNAVGERNESLMHHLANLIQSVHESRRSNTPDRNRRTFLKVTQTLLSSGVPAFTYDTQGQ